MPHVLVREMHVDGFRVDLASVLARRHGRASRSRIRPWCHARARGDTRGTRLIAEAWDAAGSIRSAAGPAFAGRVERRYRDAVATVPARRARPSREIATRIAGSSDLYAAAGKRPDE